MEIRCNNCGKLLFKCNLTGGQLEIICSKCKTKNLFDFDIKKIIIRQRVTPVIKVALSHTIDRI